MTVLLVPDPLRALHAIAAAWRARFTPLVIGHHRQHRQDLDQGGRGGRPRASAASTLRTEGNQNNEVGLPLTVLRLGPEHGAAVLEMGMYVGGEIRELAAIGRPSIGIVTAVQPVHLSRIGSIEAIEDAKAELVEALPPAADGGVAILNADDDRVRRMASRTRARVADLRLRGRRRRPRGRRSSRAASTAWRSGSCTPAGERIVEIAALGRLAVHNALAATAAGLAAGLALDEIVPGLAAPSRAPHRSTVIPAGGVVIVDDAYNASPGSVVAALELLAGPARPRADRGPGRDARAGRRARRRPPGGRRGGRDDLDVLVVVDGAPGGAAAGIVEGALAAGIRSGLDHRAPRPSAPSCAMLAVVAAGRRGAGQGFEGRRARAGRRRAVAALGGPERGRP